MERQSSDRSEPVRGGYAGPSRRQRSTIAVAVVAGFLAVMWIVGRIGDAMPSRDRPQPELAVFDVPPPPPPPPLPEPHRLAIRIAPKHALVGGGAGRHRQTPTPVVHDPSPTLLDRPTAPVATIEAPPPPSGRNLLAGIGLGGMDGIGVGIGSGSGAGDGDGSGSGSGGARPLRYARATWVTPPGPEDFLREWPRPVPRLTTPARVFLACAVKPNGRPFHCRTLAEGQPGHGYAAAAIRLTERSRVRPVFVNGQRTGMPVIVPITFLPPDANPHAEPAAGTTNAAASAAIVP